MKMLYKTTTPGIDKSMEKCQNYRKIQVTVEEPIILSLHKIGALHVLGLARLAGKASSSKFAKSIGSKRAAVAILGGLSQ
jgi:hypothetical protein